MSRPRPKINNHIGKAPRGCDDVQSEERRVFAATDRRVRAHGRVGCCVLERVAEGVRCSTSSSNIDMGRLAGRADFEKARRIAVGKMRSFVS